MHYLGNDVELYGWSVQNFRITQMSEMFDKQSGAYHDTQVVKRRQFESKYIDYTMVCAPQYSPFVEKATIIPLAIDTSKFSLQPLPELDGPLKIVHVPTSPRKKGTAYLIHAVEKLQSEGYDLELDICQEVTHDDLIQRYIKAHVSVVALLGGWYGTSGIEAMALGRPIISFIRPELIQYTDFETEEDIPVISANRESIYEVLKGLLESDLTELKNLGLTSYNYAKKYHDVKVISKRLKSIYNSL
jgi:glycosyltransferase involved in cell wall biosynthesis